MEGLMIVGLGLSAAALGVFLRGERPEWGLLLSLGAGLLLCGLVMEPLSELVLAFESLADEAELPERYPALLLRSLGLALIIQLGADCCRDAGENAVASRIEFSGRVLLLGLALPLIEEVTGLVLSILSL